MGTIKSGFDPCGIIRAGLISAAAGRTILAKTIMVAGQLWCPVYYSLGHNGGNNRICS